MENSMSFPGLSLSKGIHLILLSAMLTILGACQPLEQQPRNLGQAVQGQGEKVLSGSTVLQGTADPGGGNGADGRVLESYMVPLSQLRGYSEYIEPMFKLWASRDFDFLEAVAASKSWYVMPIALQPIDNKTLGFSFAKDGLQQLAVQTLSKVIIDTKATAASTDKEFAELVMHEIVMSWYLLKFETLRDACERIRTRSDVHENCGEFQLTMAELLFSGHKQKEIRLNDQDYDRIRRVTKWMLQEGLRASNDDIQKVLWTNKFLFFEFSQPLPDYPKDELLDVKGRDLVRILSLAPKLGQKLQSCSSNLYDRSECSFAFEVLSQNEIETILKVVIQTPHSKIETVGSLSSEISLNFSSAGAVQNLRACLSPDFESLKTGDAFDSVCLNFHPAAHFKFKESDLSLRLELSGVEVLRSVVTQKKDNSCLVIKTVESADQSLRSFVMATDQKYLPVGLVSIELQKILGGRDICPEPVSQSN